MADLSRRHFLRLLAATPVAVAIAPPLPAHLEPRELWAADRFFTGPGYVAVPYRAPDLWRPRPARLGADWSNLGGAVQLGWWVDRRLGQRVRPVLEAEDGWFPPDGGGLTRSWLGEFEAVPNGDYWIGVAFPDAGWELPYLAAVVVECD
jgi:hypothetical protein